MIGSFSFRRWRRRCRILSVSFGKDGRQNSDFPAPATESGSPVIGNHRLARKENSCQLREGRGGGKREFGKEEGKNLKTIQRQGERGRETGEGQKGGRS